MIEFSVKVDMENLRARLSQQTGGTPLERSDVAAWLAEHQFRAGLSLGDRWIADDEALEALRPWEILQRLPVCMASDPLAAATAADVQMHA